MRKVIMFRCYMLLKLFKLIIIIQKEIIIKKINKYNLYTTT